VEKLGLIKKIMAKEKGSSGKLLVDANSENINFLKTLVFLEIRHLEGLRYHIGLCGKKYIW